MADEPKRIEFSEDYVKELRTENASWRTKFRELETKYASDLGAKDVETELLKRGVSAEPSWVSRKEGQSVSEAVDGFLEKYPLLQQGEEFETQEIQKPKPMNKPKPNSNMPNRASNGSYIGKTFEEIKKDPKSRQALRQQWRSMLSTSSNKEYQGD